MLWCAGRTSKRLFFVWSPQHELLAWTGFGSQSEEARPMDLREIIRSCAFLFPRGAQDIALARRFRQDSRNPLPEKNLGQKNAL